MERESRAIKELIFDDGWQCGNRTFYHQETGSRIQLNPEEKTYEAETMDIDAETGAELTEAARVLEEEFDYTGVVREVSV